MRRKLDFVKQQQMAVKLHRQGRNNGDYLWWIVTSLVLQARAGPYAQGEPLQSSARNTTAHD